MSYIQIILIQHNRHAITRRCVASLLALVPWEGQITILDSGSTDGSDVALSKWQATLCRRSPSEGEPRRRSIEALLFEDNIGFAAANNRGIDRALRRGADYVLILNNDAYVTRDALSEMLRVAVETDAAMVAPAVYDAGDRERVDRFGITLTRSGAAYDRKSEDDGPLLCPSGCAALYRRDLVEELASDPEGFFDETFFAYAEDLDTGLRARARGYRVAFAPDAVIHHEGSATFGKGSELAYRLRHRNTIWAIAKNYSAGLLVREAPFLLAGQVLGLVNSVRRRRFRAALRGKLEGLLGAWGARRRSSGRPRLATREWIDPRFAIRR